MKLDIVSANGEKITAEVAFKWRKTRSGFSHTASAIVDGEMLSARVCYCNRTWESYPYQTAAHALCRKIAAKTYGKGKRMAACAAAYASELCAMADAQGR